VFRIVAGAMLVSVPTAVSLGFVMANWSAQTSIAVTAREIASAAARQGELAADLAGTGWEGSSK
jgi:hypothetical protein